MASQRECRRYPSRPVDFPVSSALRALTFGFPDDSETPQDWKQERKSTDVYPGEGMNGSILNALNSTDSGKDEETPLLPQPRLTQLSRTQVGAYNG